MFELGSRLFTIGIYGVFLYEFPEYLLVTVEASLEAFSFIKITANVNNYCQISYFASISLGVFLRSESIGRIPKRMHTP